MLADSDRAKSYIGQDVILALAPSAEDPGKIVIVVGHLYEYAFLSDIPFGTAFVTGFVKFTVTLGSDEYRWSGNSWNFPTQSTLDQWASELPVQLEFEEQSLPADAQAEEVRNVIAIAPLQDGMKEKYLEKANELFSLNNEQ